MVNVARNGGLDSDGITESPGKEPYLLAVTLRLLLWELSLRESSSLGNRLLKSLQIESLQFGNRAGWESLSVWEILVVFMVV